MCHSVTAKISPFDPTGVQRINLISNQKAAECYNYTVIYITCIIPQLGEKRVVDNGIFIAE